MNKKQIIKDFISKGIVVIPQYMTQDYCTSLINEMDEIKEKYPNKLVSQESENTAGDYRFFKLENLSKNANLFKYDSFIKDIINQYCKTKFSSLFVLGGIVESLEDKTTNSGGGWHRDSDEIQLKAMLYLTDVDSNNGPFLFIKKSNNYDLKRRNKPEKESRIDKLIRLIKKKKYQRTPRYEDHIIENEINYNQIFEVKGKVGTLVLFDSSYIHRGKNIIEGRRYTVTNYFFKEGIVSKFFRKRQFGKYFLPST